MHTHSRVHRLWSLVLKLKGSVLNQSIQDTNTGSLDWLCGTMQGTIGQCRTLQITSCSTAEVQEAQYERAAVSVTASCYYEHNNCYAVSIMTYF
jgi:hypothetical protein